MSSRRVVQLVGSVAVAVSLVGCSSSDSTSSVASGATQTAQDGTAVTSETPLPPPEEASFSPYSSDPIQITTGEGWIYTYQPDFSFLPAIGMTKDISQSPPGQARLLVSIGAWGGPLELLADTPGRSAPSYFIRTSAFIPSNVDFGQDVVTGMNNQVCGVFSADNSPFSKVVDGSSGFFCRIDAGVDAVAASEDEDEASVDAAVAIDTGQLPIIYIQAGTQSSDSCRLVFYPDGTVETGDWSNC